MAQLAAFYNCRTLFFKIMLMMIEAYIDTALLFEWALETHKLY